MSQRQPLDELTAREREVLDLVRLGLTNQEIASRLGITEAGVKYHVSQILSKIGVGPREEAAAITLTPRRRWWAALPLAVKAASVAILVAAVGGLGLLAWGVLRTSGDDGAADVQQGGPTPIPWLDASPAPDPAVLALRPCTSDDLEALVLPGGVAAGTTYVPIGLANRSDTPCRLLGFPDLQLLDSADEVIAADFRDASCFSGYQGCELNLPVVLEPGLAGLRPDAQPIQGQAVVHMAFSTGAPPACNQDNPYAATVRLRLPEAGGSFDLALFPNASPPGIEVCYPVGLTRFEDPALFWAPPEASPLFASIEGPAQVHAGETIRLLVTLRNISESGLSFDQPCSNYTLHIGGEKLGVLAEHALNCVPAGVLDPGKEVTFEVMATLPSTLPDIPSDAPLSFNWSLDRPPASADLQMEIASG